MRRVSLPERPDWRAKADEIGFVFHGAAGERYWDERGYLAFTLQEIEEAIEAPTNELERLCLAFVDLAVNDDRILSRLGIPAAFHDLVRNSWRAGERNLYGRFDLAYDGNGPAKLLEYNADTPTALFEAAVFQWTWLEDQMARGALPRSADQFNSIHERLVAAWGQVLPGVRHLHVASVDDSLEDRGTVAYLADCAVQAGLTTSYIAIQDIGLRDDGHFVDLEEREIAGLFKLYPWEWLFAEPFGKNIPGSGARFIEPPWKACLSTKALLPQLWAMEPGHPNLLPAFFEGDAAAATLSGDVVRKPIHSREGANIELKRGGITIDRTDGAYARGPAVLQQAVGIPNLGGGFVVLGSWVVASQACGLGVRESDTPITRDDARFVPHVILD